MDLKRLREGKRTRTGMNEEDLLDFCRKPVVPKNDRKKKWMEKVRAYRRRHKAKRKKKRSRNPHLTSDKWRFIGMFKKADMPEVRRMLRIHGIANKVTKDHMKTHDRTLREVYISRERFDEGYRAITRLFEGGKAA